MTRKRFIKLIMSHGVSRNDALGLVAYYNFANIPYKRAYLDFMIKNSFITLGKAIYKMGESLSTTKLAFMKMAESIREAFK